MSSSLIWIILVFIQCTKSTSNSKSSDSSDSSKEDIDHDDIRFGAYSLCQGYYDEWDEYGTPIEDKDMRGRSKYITSKTIKRALQNIKYYKRYNLYHIYNDLAFGFPGWIEPLIFTTELIPLEIGDSLFFIQRLETPAHGNIGTQFDHFCHSSYLDTINSNKSDYNNWVFFNDIRVSDIILSTGFKEGYCIDNLSPIISTAHLIDAAGYLDVDIMDYTQEIDEILFFQILSYQNMNINDIKEGDIILFYTGYSEYYGTDDYYFILAPGITTSLAKNILFDLKVSIIGADTFAIEIGLNTELHSFWFTCAGGYLHETLDLKEWVMDARNGDAPYIGTYFFAPNPIAGGLASMGAPYVIV